MIQVNLQNTTRQKFIPAQKKFQQWINKASKHISKKMPKYSEAIDIIIVGEKKSAYLNKRYRKKTGSTNILSFHYLQQPGIPPLSLGDLVICAKLVQKEAKAQGKTIESHWAHLTIHGFLHLLGCDHETKTDAKKMERLETKIIIDFGFKDPYCIK